MVCVQTRKQVKPPWSMAQKDVTLKYWRSITNPYRQKKRELFLIEGSNSKSEKRQFQGQTWQIIKLASATKSNLSPK